ncbi:rhodanese-like domain-containing protein [Sporichthya polymorpha]|uniref:rhodanese-like domain-containing protein n=1 Tax=Sporichthya polymorpha TaxID=35751 RepID=UPI000372FAED|nr:rhodanese-like domain-containing protein [Sporichthya polymorpha]
MATNISRTELLLLLASNRPVHLVDALPSGYFDQEHLPGAVNLVEDDVAALAAQLLPQRDETVVTYCANTACPNSRAVARGLEALGYTDVRTYEAGIQDWVEAGLPTESALVA